MNVKVPSFPELYQKAFAILTREMGVVDTMRFFSQLGLGAGNYTEERQAMFGDLSLDEYRKAVEQQPIPPGAINPAGANQAP